MPSPFPGMDPYFESELWTSFQSLLANGIAIQLAALLNPRYVAWPSKRYYCNSPELNAATSIEPRPVLVESSEGVQSKQRTKPSAAKLPLQLATIMPRQVPHMNVEIRDVQSRRIVTAIEILSPTNKSGQGRSQYLSRRNRLLDRNVHLLEIDLVRQGKRVPMVQTLPDMPYFVLLGRLRDRPMTDVWPIAFHEPLPMLPIPLKRGDAEVRLNLQAVVDELYDLIGFERVIDYSGPPDISLPFEIKKWADELLRKAGHRL